MIYSATDLVSKCLWRCFRCWWFMQLLVQCAGWAQLAYSDDLIKLKDDRITESSGLVSSQRKPGTFWTHNDSGNDPELYAFDCEGHKLAEPL